MQLPSYPTTVPSGCTLSGTDQRSSTPGSHLLHRAVENNSISNSLSSNNGNHLLNPSSNSNNKAPLMTINENWAALDASTMMPQPPYGILHLELLTELNDPTELQVCTHL